MLAGVGGGGRSRGAGLLASAAPRPPLPLLTATYPVGPVWEAGAFCSLFRFSTLSFLGPLCPTRHAACHQSNPSVFSGCTVECRSLDKLGSRMPERRACRNHLPGKETKTLPPPFWFETRHPAMPVSSKGWAGGGRGGWLRGVTGVLILTRFLFIKLPLRDPPAGRIASFLVLV